MKIESYKYPKSAFLSMEKDMNVIVDLVLKNENLKKLLYYTSPDCLEKPNLTRDQSFGLFQNNIKIVPKIKIDHDLLNYIMIGFDDFVTNPTNPEFRNNTLEFDIICHFDQWQLKDYSLRPYRIAAELDSMFCQKVLTNMGKVKFIGATKINISDEFAGLCLLYNVIHGGEDKVNAPNPRDEEINVTNFDRIFNNDGFEISSNSGK